MLFYNDSTESQVVLMEQQAIIIIVITIIILGLAYFKLTPWSPRSTITGSPRLGWPSPISSEIQEIKIRYQDLRQLFYQDFVQSDFHHIIKAIISMNFETHIPTTQTKSSNPKHHSERNNSRTLTPNLSVPHKFMRESSRLAIVQHLAFYRLFDLRAAGKPIPQVDMYSTWSDDAILEALRLRRHFSNVCLCWYNIIANLNCRQMHGCLVFF